MASSPRDARDASGLRVGVVASRFNELVTDRLLRGARKALGELGLPDGALRVVRVAGAYEIPLFAELLAASGEIDAVICLGAIVRGETQHHEYLGHAIFHALQSIQLQHHVPVAAGILTTENLEQALARSGDDPGNKGYESAVTAVECANLRREFS